MQVTNKPHTRRVSVGVVKKKVNVFYFFVLTFFTFSVSSNRSVGFLPRERSPNAPAPYQAKMRSTTAGLLLLIGSANSLSLGLAPVRRSAVHRVVMQVSERQPH